MAPDAVALPKGDSDFHMQTLRLRKFDARNKSEDGKKPYYSYGQAPTQTSERTNPQNVITEQESFTEPGTDKGVLTMSDVYNEATVPITDQWHGGMAKGSLNRCDRPTNYATTDAASRKLKSRKSSALLNAKNINCTKSKGINISIPFEIEKTRTPPEEVAVALYIMLLGVLKKMQNPYHQFN